MFRHGALFSAHCSHSVERREKARNCANVALISLPTHRTAAGNILAFLSSFDMLSIAGVGEERWKWACTDRASFFPNLLVAVVGSLSSGARVTLTQQLLRDQDRLGRVEAAKRRRTITRPYDSIGVGTDEHIDRFNRGDKLAVPRVDLDVVVEVVYFIIWANVDGPVVYSAITE